MQNARVISDVRFRGFKVRMIYYFGEYIYIYKVNGNVLHSVSFQSVKKRIKRSLKNK